VDSFVETFLARQNSAGSLWDSFVEKIPGRRRKVRCLEVYDPAMNCDYVGQQLRWQECDLDQFDIWKLGYDRRWGYPDPKTLSTVIRDGSYDFLTNSQRWHDTPGFGIPNSMYLTSKPGFFGRIPRPDQSTTGAIHASC
jgi:hypothetical protein